MVAKHKVKLIFREEVRKDFWVFGFERPEGFEYRAGQYVSVKVDETGQRRSYSLASYPEQKERLDILVDVSPMGVGSRFLLGLQLGEEAEVLGPMGMFTLEDTKDGGGAEELAFVGTGSGVVPLRSMIQHRLAARMSKRMTLHWGMRYEDAFWREEFEELAARHNNFKFDLVISKASESWQGCRGHVTDCLGEYEGFEGKAFYLCGSQQMIKDVSEFLASKGVSRERVFFEKFY